MTSTAHALVAAAIATRFPDPVVASTLAFGSHFIMDCIPHWDVGTHWRNRSKFATGTYAVGETVFGIALALYIFHNAAPLPTLISAIFFSELPDWLETPWYIFFARQNNNTPRPNAGFWEKFTYGIYKLENQFHTKALFPLGVITQVLTVIFFMKILLG